METITLDQAVKIFDSGEVFSVRFVKFDAKRQTGGDVREYKSVRASRPKLSNRSNSFPSAKKNQNHFDNFTRNVFLVLDGYTTTVVKKIHLLLVLKINDKILIL